MEQHPAQQTVVVVDDDLSVRRALQRLLQSAGYAVETFDRGADFLAYPALATVDCVILDIRMPELSGLEVQRRLTELHPDVPVIIVTGHGDDEVRRLALEAGAIAIIEKPFDDWPLLDAIARAVTVRGA